MGAGPHHWLWAYYNMDPDNMALPLKLYQDGFDVWFPVARGQPGSRAHNEYTIRDKEFWDWSWYELGIYETKAYFDFIYNETKRPISYIGFSQGTSQMYVAIAEEYEFMKSRTNKVALFSPCSIVNPE